MQTTAITLVLLCIAATIGWLYWEQRQRLHREVDQLLLRAEVVIPETGMVFLGREATVLLRDVLPLGSDSNGPGVSAQFLCTMPDGQVYRVLIESARSEQAATVQVHQCSDAEIQDILAMYPYLPHLKKNLSPRSRGSV
mgnify:FL=1|jgi:hypothetical protein